MGGHSFTYYAACGAAGGLIGAGVGLAAGKEALMWYAIAGVAAGVFAPVAGGYIDGMIAGVASK